MNPSCILVCLAAVLRFATARAPHERGKGLGFAVMAGIRQGETGSWSRSSVSSDLNRIACPANLHSGIWRDDKKCEPLCAETESWLNLPSLVHCPALSACLGYVLIFERRENDDLQGRGHGGNDCSIKHLCD